jgi:hypothetical protein
MLCHPTQNLVGLRPHLHRSVSAILFSYEKAGIARFVLNRFVVFFAYAALGANKICRKVLPLALCFLIMYVTTNDA